MSDAKPWLPELDDEIAPYFDAAREGRVCLQQCSECARWMYPHRRRCQECGSTDIEWRDASGRGTLYAHALQHRVYHPRHEGRTPLIMAWVDLEEGVRVPTNIVDADPHELRVGQAMQVTFETFPDGGVVPVFTPATT